MKEQIADSLSGAVIEAARHQVLLEAEAVRSVADQIDETFVTAASWLRWMTGKVVFTGAGTSGLIGRRSAHLFSVSGTPALFMHPSDALNGTMGLLEADDVVIALSKGGGSAEVNEVVKRAAARGVRIIAICSRPESELARAADLSIEVTPDNGGDPGGFLAMGSTLGHSAWLDAMANVLMRARRYPWSELLFTHPGGAVGQIVEEPAPLEPLDLPRPSGAEGPGRS